MINNIRIGKDFIIISTLLILIFLILEAFYHFYISTSFNYFGFSHSFSADKYVLTKGLFLVLILLSHNTFRKSLFLYSILVLLIFFFYIPNAIMFSLGDFPYGPFLSNTFFVFTFLITPYINFKIPVFKSPESVRELIIFVLIFIMILPILFTFRLDINLNTLLLSQVYDTRDVFSERLSPAISYLYNFAAKTILPIAMIFFLIRKKYLLVIISFLFLLYLYLISGNKLVYFTAVLLVFFYYAGDTFTVKIRNFLLIAFGCFLVFPIIDLYILPSPVLSGTFVNRFLFIPALLNQNYFEFFQDRPFFFAETHFFNWFFHSPYDMPVGFLITKVYLNEPTVFSNNGIVSDGYMNLGYPGVVLFTILFCLLFSFFNSFKLHKGFFGIFFSYIYIILSAPFFTCLITGGVMLFLLLSFLVLKTENKAVAVTSHI